jgi:hypothetical protein
MVMPEGEVSVELVRERRPAGERCADEPVSSRDNHVSPGHHPAALNAGEAHSASRRAAEMHASDAAGMHTAAEAASTTVETATTATVTSTTTSSSASENSGRSSQTNCSQRHQGNYRFAHHRLSSVGTSRPSDRQQIKNCQ